MSEKKLNQKEKYLRAETAFIQNEWQVPQAIVH